MLKRAVFAFALGLPLIATPGVYAGSLISFDSTQGAAYRNDEYNVGVEIQVGSTDQLVTALGGQAYGSGGTDLQLSDMQVGLWDASNNNLLASVTVLSTSTLIDSYRYVTLGTPITLTHGQDYYLGALVGTNSNSNNYWVDGFYNSTTPFAAESGFTIIDNTYSDAPPFAVPNVSGAAVGRWGPANALTQAVPEPSTIALALMGGLITISAARKNRKAIA